MIVSPPPSDGSPPGDGPHGPAASPGRDDAWTAEVVTLFPEAFPGPLGLSLTGRALADGLWRLRTIDLRAFGEGRHRLVDDTPAGGGAGMVLRADVVAAALASAPRRDLPLLYVSPRGRPFDQARARDLAQSPGITFLCGRFEGVDQRVLDHFDAEEVSLGDFVLTGGEVAAMALIDATVRLIPRVLGNQASVEEESFSHGLLEHPHYTKPAVWQGPRDPRSSPLGTSRERRPLAEDRGRKADQGTSSRPLAGLRGAGRGQEPGRRGRALGRAHHRRDRRA